MTTHAQLRAVERSPSANPGGFQGGSIPPLVIASSGDRHRTTELTFVVNYNCQVILEDLIENLQSLGQEYTDEQAQAWAWDRFFQQYPEYCELPENYG